ncbi:hypothetical protein AGMMS49525_03500 [Bacteroidia bacterium]|nr:hypothetical protein AGMMS49525_03500 [Bacteroidia bacterium]
MKRNFFFLSWLAIGLLASSCSNDLEKGRANADGNRAISFDVWANKQLRATTQAADVTDFAVLATNPAAAPGAQVLIDGLIVTGSNATGWTYSPKGAWPDMDPVNFFAVSPAAATGVAPVGHLRR